MAKIRRIPTPYQEFKRFWLPIYQKQFKTAIKENDFKTQIAIRNNIKNNWHFSDKEKQNLFEFLGVYGGEDINGTNNNIRYSLSKI